MINSHNKSGRSLLNRCLDRISKIACVVLFSIGALMMYDSQNYIMVAVYVFFAVFTPLQIQGDAMHDKLLTSETGTGSDAGMDQKADAQVKAEETIG